MSDHISIDDFANCMKAIYKKGIGRRDTTGAAKIAHADIFYELVLNKPIKGFENTLSFAQFKTGYVHISRASVPVPLA